MNKFFDKIRDGHLEAVKEMVTRDPSLLRAKDENGLDGFTVARYSRRNDVAQFLLENGSELSVFAAAMAGVTARVKELLDTDSTLISAYSHDGWTALHLAAFFGQKDTAESLIGRGANVNARSLNTMQNTPLHAAVAGRSIELVALLTAHGADVNARQEGGWMPLHTAAQNDDLELVQLLISLGAQVKARADNNQNALDLALTRGHQKMVELLEENS